MPKYIAAVAVVFAALAAVQAADQPLGRRIEGFQLQDFRGTEHALSDYHESKLVVLAFLGTECPLAKLYGPRLEKLAKEYEPRGVSFLGVNANVQDSITEIAAGSGRDDRFVGMHFCLPAQLMKLVEMSPGRNTSEETFLAAWNFCKALGQNPVKTKDSPGFILNYFLIPYNNDAIRLVEQGVADPTDIDKAIKTALGYAMGPFELLDLIGMDTQLLLCEAMHGLTNEPRAACPPLVKRMIAAGHLGRKTGRGFHVYKDGKMFGA